MSDPYYPDYGYPESRPREVEYRRAPVEPAKSSNTWVYVVFGILLFLILVFALATYSKVKKAVPPFKNTLGGFKTKKKALASADAAQAELIKLKKTGGTGKFSDL